MTGCAICHNRFDRKKYDRVVRLGYGCDLTCEVGFAIAHAVLVRDKRGKHGASWRIQVCSQCRYDLMGAIRRWISGEFVETKDREYYRDRDCPCCGFDTTQDGRSLRVSGVPGLETLHQDFNLADSVAILTTCQDCRSDFTKKVLCGWLAGEFITDGRPVNQGVRNNVMLWYDQEAGKMRIPPRYGWPTPRVPRRVAGRVLA